MSNQAQGLVRGLDMKAPLKPILMAYANYADELGYVWAGVETIAFDTGYGLTAVKDARKALISAGWMASKRRFGTSAIVRLNLGLMSARQVDRGDAHRIHPDLEFAEETRRSEPNSRETAEREPAGQNQTAARRLNVNHEQPPRGRMNSRDTAEYSAATRPLSIRESSEDPSVDARANDRANEGSPPEESKTDPAQWSLELVAALDYGRHRRPTLREARELATLIEAAAVIQGLSERTIRHHCQLALREAKTNPVAYLVGALIPERLPIAEKPAPVAPQRSNGHQPVRALTDEDRERLRAECGVPRGKRFAKLAATEDSQ